MIYTITMNPAIDKTIELDELRLGGLNRIKTVIQDVGGKGINVSKTIKALGGVSIALGFVGGNTGKIIVDALDELEIEHDFVELDEPTRINTKAIETSGRVTEINEPGPIVNANQVEKILAKVRQYADENALFVIAGSVPQGVTKDIYAKITDIAHLAGAQVLLDADGELFEKALISHPDYIKPNREELESYKGFDSTASQKDLVAIGHDLQEQGIANVVVSMGKEGALFLLNGNEAFVPGLKVDAHSTVGAGDSLVAGIAYSVANNLEPDELIRLGVAISAGAVTTIGTKPPQKELVDQLKRQVKIEKIA